MNNGNKLAFLLIKTISPYLATITKSKLPLIPRLILKLFFDQVKLKYNESCDCIIGFTFYLFLCRLFQSTLNLVPALLDVESLRPSYQLLQILLKGSNDTLKIYSALISKYK